MMMHERTIISLQKKNVSRGSWAGGGDPAQAAVGSERTNKSMMHVLNLRTTTSHKCEAVWGRARIEGSKTLVSLTTRLESREEEEEARSEEVCGQTPHAGQWKSSADPAIEVWGSVSAVQISA